MTPRTYFVACTTASGQGPKVGAGREDVRVVLTGDGSARDHQVARDAAARSFALSRGISPQAVWIFGLWGGE